MEVWLFGNPDLSADSLPVRLQQQLAVALPQFDFVICDPLDEWPKKDELLIIDTVMGLKDIKIFTSLKDFEQTPLVTLHDFDLKTELEFRAKLGKLPPFTIIGLPVGFSEADALEKIKLILSQYST